MGGWGNGNGGNGGSIPWRWLVGVLVTVLTIAIGTLWGGHERRIEAVEESDREQSATLGRIDDNVKDLKADVREALRAAGLRPPSREGHR